MTLYERWEKAEREAKAAAQAETEAIETMEAALRAWKRISKIHFIQKKAAHKKLQAAHKAVERARREEIDARQTADDAKRFWLECERAGTAWAYNM